MEDGVNEGDGQVGGEELRRELKVRSRDVERQTAPTTWRTSRFCY